MGEASHIKCSVSVVENNRLVLLETEMNNYHISWYKDDIKLEKLDDKIEIVVNNAKEEGKSLFIKIRSVNFLF